MYLSRIDVDQMKKALFEFIDDEATRIDSVWWCFSEGNEANWPSKVLPYMDHPAYREWAAAGIDPVRLLVDETRSRGLEAFFSYRINGSDNDVPGKIPALPMKEAHPEWLIHTWGRNGYWTFAYEGVRDYKLSILREVAEEYAFDGMEIDFARICPVLPPGRQWENRGAVTAFVRSVRSMLLEVADTRGRPFLLAARVPENLEGCHFDGLDVETWAREQLVDIFVVGVRSFDADLSAFRAMSKGTDIKLYPALDDHHSSDGYQFPPIEVLRGVLANWWQQGADGVQAFNFAHSRPETLARYGMNDRWPGWATHLQLYRELSDVEAMLERDKVFVVQRRGGGHGPSVVPNPESWTTPRLAYFNTNMLAALPASLANDGKADTLRQVYVADDVASDARRVDRITVRVLLSDGAAGDLPDGSRLSRVVIATIGHPDGRLHNTPPARGIADQIELRLNNARLGLPSVDGGWLVFDAHPKQFAVGSNLVGLRLAGCAAEVDGEVSVEKLEVHVQYR